MEGQRRVGQESSRKYHMSILPPQILSFKDSASSSRRSSEKTWNCLTPEQAATSVPGSEHETFVGKARVVACQRLLDPDLWVGDN